MTKRLMPRIQQRTALIASVFKRLLEVEQLFHHIALGMTRMLKGELVVKSLSDKERLAYAPSPIDYNELRYLRIISFAQFPLLFLATNHRDSFDLTLPISYHFMLYLVNDNFIFLQIVPQTS